MHPSPDDSLDFTLYHLGSLEQAYAAQLLSAAPKDGSAQGLADFAIQTQFLRGHLAALAALRELLTSPTQSEES